MFAIQEVINLIQVIYLTFVPYKIKLKENVLNWTNYSINVG